MSGVSVREYGTVTTVGSDGTYMVFERLDNSEAIKRRGGTGTDAATAMKRLRSFASLGRGAGGEVRP